MTLSDSNRVSNSRFFWSSAAAANVGLSPSDGFERRSVTAVRWICFILFFAGQKELSLIKQETKLSAQSDQKTSSQASLDKFYLSFLSLSAII